MKLPVSRDTTSFGKILEGVKSTATSHPGDGLIVLSGAHGHMIGAIVQLTRSDDFNVRYALMEGCQISTRTKDSDAKLKPER